MFSVTKYYSRIFLPNHYKEKGYALILHCLHYMSIALSSYISIIKLSVGHNFYVNYFVQLQPISQLSAGYNLKGCLYTSP